MTGNERDPGKLDRRLAALANNDPPNPDLWPAIETRIRTLQTRPARPSTAVRPGWQLLVMAASVAIIAVLAASLFHSRDARPPDAGPVAVAEPPASPFGPGFSLGSGYQAARAGLADDLERRLETLAPEARATVLENLATIRRAAAEINQALGEDPANVLLQHQLLAVYQDELSVLANLQRVTGRLPTRNEI